MMFQKTLRDRLADHPRLAGMTFTALVALTQAGGALAQCSTIHTGP